MYKEHWNACSWLESNWLNIPEVVCSYDVHNQSFVLLHLQKWAHAYRDMAYYAAMETNNGTESLNKALKYSYLLERKSLSLSGIALLLIDTFFQMCIRSIYFRTTNYLRNTGNTVIAYLLTLKAIQNQ